MSALLRIESYALPLEMETSEHRQLASLYAAAVRESNDEDSLYEQYDNLHETDQVRVARIGNAVVGMAAYDTDHDKVFLGALAVERSYRGQGIVGGRMLRYVIDEASTFGASALDLSCYERTVPFYQAHQFEVVARGGLLYDMRREL